MSDSEKSTRTRSSLLTLGALGIVFGDIGTSPLYAMKEIFGGPHALVTDRASVYGALSLIFWSITIVVSLKYVIFIMRADNDGEGGIMALIALVRRVTMRTTRTKYSLIALGIFGAALFYGDAIITPAISVLSAVEGLEVAAPSLGDYVVPLTLVILTGLFLIQRFGTGAVGRAFGPVMITWFSVLAILGISQIVQNPEVLKALSPWYAVDFFLNHGSAAFLALGSVVLAVTGAEALYADMGHFGRRPIRRAWFWVVFPALVLNYFGQGALLLSNPSLNTNPFFYMAPEWARLPLVVLAAMAAIIASQAVISGAFSVTRQAVRLDFLPLLHLRHTSTRNEGQIYVPAVNWVLYAAIVATVIGFQSSSALAAAYGIAVTGTLAIDTILVFVVVRSLWHKPMWMVLVGATGFLVIDLAFFSANLTKITHGGWFPLVVALALFILLTTWQRGRSLLVGERIRREGQLRDFIQVVAKNVEPVHRVSGTAVFMNANTTTTPLALRYNYEHNRILHQTVVVFTVETLTRPYVDEGERIVIDDLRIPDDGIYLVTARYGFSEKPDVPAALRLAAEQGLDVDVDNASYFITRSTIEIGASHEMSKWRKKLFIAMNRNSGNGTKYFNLPADRVVMLGSSISI